MKIDVFCHVTPPKFLQAFEKMVPPQICAQLPCKTLPTLTDMDARFRLMEKVKGMTQVLTLTNPPIETVVGPEAADELSRRANDEMAELVEKYPDFFVGAVACLPMNDMDAALRETDRAIKDLNHCGVQLFTDVAGKTLDSPEFMPLYEKMAGYDLPIFIHPYVQAPPPAKDAPKPTSPPKMDYAANMERGALKMTLGTPFSMIRLVFSRVFDRFPGIKFITHHCGSVIPYLAHRIEMNYLYIARDGINLGFKKPIPDYFKLFYADTALHGNLPALMCGYSYFGAQRMMFATDMPFDAEIGAWSVRKNIEGIEKMPIPEAEKKMIWEGNAKKLMHLRIK